MYHKLTQILKINGNIDSTTNYKITYNTNIYLTLV
jgi:hypothetical protein